MPWTVYKPCAYLNLTRPSNSVTILSALRLKYLILSGYGPLATDGTYDISFIYAQLETSVAIIAACGPALKPLVAQWFPRREKSTTYFANKGSPYYGGSNLFRTTASTNHNRLGSHPDDAFALRRMGSDRASGGRGRSSSESEESIMTYHGIMRKTEITLQYHDKPNTLPQMDSMPGSEFRDQSPTNSEEESSHGILKKTEITMQFQDLPQGSGSAERDHLESSASSIDVGRAV